MTKKVSPIPEGYTTVTPYLFVKGAAKALEFYKKAFGAKVVDYCECPETGLVMHAEIKIGDSMIMLSDECPGPQGRGTGSPKTLKGVCACMHLYVKNADTAFKKAVKCGAKVIMPLEDMFWGDRYGQVEDPFGHRWSLATHKEDLSKKEIKERAIIFFSTQPKKKKAKK